MLDDRGTGSDKGNETWVVINEKRGRETEKSTGREDQRTDKVTEEIMKFFETLGG
jgi:hypothetical protein